LSIKGIFTGDLAESSWPSTCNFWNSWGNK